MTRQTPKHTPEHEAKCCNTGICCHFTLPRGDTNIVVEGMHCKFLRKTGDNTFTCSVYAERLEKAPWCNDIHQARAQNMLDAKCGYNLTGQGKTRLSNEQYDIEWNALLPMALAQNFPASVSKEAFLEELRRREPDKEWECIPCGSGVQFKETGKKAPFIMVLDYPRHNNGASENDT